MKQHLITLLTVIVATVSLQDFRAAGAQSINTFPVTGSKNDFRVLYLTETDSSVQLLCRYTPVAMDEGDAPCLKNIGRKTHVATSDGNYALTGTLHLPILNEAEIKYARLTGASPSLNCILEFEKFPFDEPFDLVEEERSEGASISLTGLLADRGNPVSTSADEFLAGTAYTEYGYHFEDGMPVHYLDGADLSLLSRSWPYQFKEKHYLYVGFRIVNRSDNPLPVRFSDISASAQRLTKKGKTAVCKSTILKEKDADDEWRSSDLDEVLDELPTNAGQYVAGVSGAAAAAPGVSPLASLGLFAFGMLMTGVSMPDVEPYMVERDKERELTMQKYLRDTVLQKGDTLAAFVCIKYRDEPASTDITISLDGKNYDLKY